LKSLKRLATKSSGHHEDNCTLKVHYYVTSLHPLYVQTSRRN